MIRRRTAKESRKFVTNPGSKWYQKKHGEVQPDGTIKLVNDEVVDIQEKMDAEYPMTTIENILANSLPGEYFGDDGLHGIDTIEMPTNLAEFMQFQIDQRNRFDTLPISVKEKFDNDFNKFLATAGSEEWMKKLGYVETSADVDQPDPAEKEVNV